MMKMLVVGAVLAVSFGSFGFELAGVEGGATVVVAQDAEESSFLAAQEITNYVARLTGWKLKMERWSREDVERCGDRPVVLIGTRDKFPGAPPKAALEKLNATKKTESHWIGVEGNRMWIVGWEEVAELYGAYRFLEDKLGIRWFRAATEDDPGDYVPTRESLEVKGWGSEKLVIEPYVEFREPSFTERRLDTCGASNLHPAPNAQTCAVRNGYQIICYSTWYPREKAANALVADFFGPRIPRRRKCIGGGHNIFIEVWPPDDKHFKEHPEYFALVGGKRVKDKQYCYSNKELLNLAADRAAKKIATNGDIGEYVFALWDTMSGACQCEKCIAMATAEETKRGIESTRFHTFVNYMADRIYARCPTANLLYLAYWTYRRPPDPRVRHDKRMPVQYCLHERCYGHDFADPACLRNAVRLTEMREWMKLAPYVFTYEYFSATPSLYDCNDLSMARDLKTYHNMGLAGWKEEAIFSDAKHAISATAGRSALMRRVDRMPSNWQRYWLCGHLSWDITQDENALLEEAESKYYGPTYPAMRKYQALRRKLWNANRNCLGYPTGDQRTPTLLNMAGAKETLLALLDEADNLAGANKIFKHRVADDRRWLTEYWIKPNDKLRASAGKALSAPRVAKGAIKVDGDGADEAWVRAVYADDFMRPGGAKPVPTELATSVGVCQDGESLYFLVTAKEPAVGRMRLKGEKDVGVLGDDGIELFLFPPSMDNRYYHICVNPKGAVYDAKCPGNEAGFDLGVEAKGRIQDGSYVIELRVPANGMHPLSDGETWKINIARNRTICDKITPQGIGVSLGAAAYHDTLAYRSLEIAGKKNLLANGAFERLNGKAKPANWALAYAAAAVVEENGNRFLRLNSDVVYNLLSLPQRAKPVRIRYAFRARGKGKLKTFFYSFTDTPNARAKHGYDRRFNPNHRGQTLDLTSQWRPYSGTFTVPADERCSLAFVSGGAGAEIDLDDVTAVVDDTPENAGY